MAFILYFFGWLAVIIGGTWAGLGFAAIVAAQQPLNGGELGAALGVLIQAPGTGLLFAGVIFMAIGAVVSRLDHLVRYARAAAVNDTFRRDNRRWTKAETEEEDEAPAARQPIEPRL